MSSRRHRNIFRTVTMFVSSTLRLTSSNKIVLKDENYRCAKTFLNNEVRENRSVSVHIIDVYNSVS